MAFFPRVRNPRYRRHPSTTQGAPPGAGVGTTTEGKTITRVGLCGAITAMTTTSFIGKSAQGGGRPYPSAATSTVSVSAAIVAKNSAVTITFQAKDGAGANITVGGATVTFGTSGGTSAGTIGAVTDVGDGTYTASFTGTTSGFTATTITANVDGVDVSSSLPTVRVYETPTVTAISPSIGTTAGGTSVTITGTLFDPAATVTIGGSAATSVTVVSTTSITCTTPAVAAGTVNVVVTNTGLSGTLTNGYVYTDGVLFSSDWTTATGTTSNALRDGTKWTAADNGGSLLAVVATSGLTGFPSTMTNCLKIRSTKTLADDVTKTGIGSTLTVGEARYYRVYLLNDISDAAGNYTDITGNHPLEPASGDEAFSWNWNFGSRNNGKFPITFNVLEKAYPTRYYPGNPQVDLNKGEAYRLEWKVLKISNATSVGAGTGEVCGHYNVSARIYDKDNTLLYQDSNLYNASNQTLGLNPTVPMMNSAIPKMFVGNNAASTWSGMTTAEYFYVGGVMVRDDDWCGAF